MHDDLCVCDRIPHITIDTRIVVLMHHREWAKTTATAVLAAAAIDSCEIRLRGHPKIPLDLTDIVQPERRPLLLYPAEHAIELTGAFVAADPRPITLVVPDGSWRQASKVRTREPALAQVPCVRLPAGAPTRFRLRSEPKPDGVATCEAIARALGIIEGPQVQQQLEEVFDVLVERTLESRGTLDCV